MEEMDFTEDFLLARRSLRDGANEEVKSIVEKSSNLHLHFDTSGFSLLHYAARYGNAEITQYLLDKGCHVDTRTLEDAGWTPFMLAVDGRHLSVVQTLLQAGADIEIYNNNKQSAVELAYSEHHIDDILPAIFDELRKKYRTSEEIAQKLIDFKCPLSYAVYTREARVIECMLERGIAIESQDYLGQTALHAAVSLSDVKIVKLLLQNGANVEAVGYKGETPLFYLLEENEESNEDHQAILRCLLERRVSITSCTEDGEFQATFALLLGDRNIVGTILSSIKDFTVRNEFMATVLHYIASNTKPGVIEALKIHVKKFHIDALDDEGSSPLFWALQKGNVNMVKFLLDQGAQVYDYIFDLYTKTNPRMALHDDCAEILLRYGANPQQLSADANGRTITIFDDIAIHQWNEYVRINLAIAQLAILEKQGIEIVELIRLKIQSHQPFQKYFDKCRRILDLNISGTVTVFQLLTVKTCKLVKYMKNDDLIVKLMRIGHKQKLKTFYRNYYNNIVKRVSNALTSKTLREIAAKIIRKLVNHQLAENTLVIEYIIDYLDDRNLWKLYKIYKDML